MVTVFGNAHARRVVCSTETRAPGRPEEPHARRTPAAVRPPSSRYFLVDATTRERIGHAIKTTYGTRWEAYTAHGTKGCTDHTSRIVSITQPKGTIGGNLFPTMSVMCDPCEGVRGNEILVIVFCRHDGVNRSAPA